MLGSGIKRLRETLGKKCKIFYLSHIVSLSILFTDPEILFIDEKKNLF